MIEFDAWAITRQEVKFMRVRVEDFFLAVRADY